MRAALPIDEQERLRVLRELDIGSGRDPDLDDIAGLAAAICGTPISLVSLIEAERQYLKAGVGVILGETPRDESFCAHAILGAGLLVVPDARADARFADNPHVLHEPGVRFYAGAPLTTSSGHRLGTLCVVDAVPRRLGIAQLRALRALARQVTVQFELRCYATAVAAHSTRQHEVERLHDELGPLLSGRLRQPLAELRRCVEVLRDRDFCPPEVGLLVGAAVHADAPDLLRLLDNLFRLADPLGGDPVLERRQVDLAALAEWAVREVRPIAEAKDVRLGLDVTGSAPVLADPARLAQALSHLVFNAVKFTPCAGQVRVRVVAGLAASLELFDTGAQGEPARLFEHMVNGALRRPADRATSADAGLAAVKSILDAHHASVALCDGPDAGTALHVVFPPVG